MKKIFQVFALLFVFIIVSSASAFSQNNLPDALKKAQQENKHVLIDFSGSDWCRSCILLERTILSTNEFKAFADKALVIVHADFPRLKKNQLPKEQVKMNEALAEKYNKNGQFPTVVILDKNGKMLGKTGYKKLSPQQYIEHIKSFF